jgi:hypothetical protein
MSSDLPAIAPGQSTEIALTVTVSDPKRAIGEDPRCARRHPPAGGDSAVSAREI